MSPVEWSLMERALALQLRAYPAILYIENKRTISCIAQVPVPTILPCRLFRRELSIRRRLIGGWRYTLNDRERLIQQYPLMVINDRIHLSLDTIPDFVETVFANNELVAQTLKVALHAELIVR